MPAKIGQLADASHGPATAPWERPSRDAYAFGPVAAGLALVVGGTILLGMTGTILPIMSGLRSPPIEAIGAHD